MRYKLGFILHNQEGITHLLNLTEGIGHEFVFCAGGAEPAVEAAYTLEKEHRVDAILCGPVTYSHVRELVRVPVVPIYLESFSLLNSICEALQYGKRIAFVQFYNAAYKYDLKQICEITGCTVESFMLRDESEVDSVLEQIQAAHCEVVISTLEYILQKVAVLGCLGFRF